MDLKTLILAAGHTPPTLAVAAGCSAQAIYRFCRGHRPHDRLALALAHQLGTTPQAIRAACAAAAPDRQTA